MASPSHSNEHRRRRDRTKPIGPRAGEEEQLHKVNNLAESRLNYLVLSSPAVIYTCESASDYAATYITPNVKTQLGYDPKEFLDDPGFWLRHIHAEDRQRVCRDLPALFEKGEYVHEYRFQHKDGTYRWMHDRLNLIRDPQGKPVEMIGCWTDVTDRKQAEQAVRESEEKYRDLAEAINDIPYTATPEGILTYISPQVVRYGLSVQEVVSKNLLEFICPQDRDRVALEFQETMTTGREFPTEFRLKDKKGCIHWLEDYGRIQRDESGKIVGLSGVLRDITDRKRAEEALREKELYLRTALSNAPIILFVNDPKGIINFVAGKGLEAMGLTPDELLGRSVFDVFPNTTEIHEHLDRALTGESFTSTLQFGGRVHECLCSPLQNQDGSIIGVIGVLTDITGRAEAENALLEKNIALRELLAGIEEQKNEIGRTILTNVDKIIMPLIHVLEQGLPEDQQRYTDLLKQSLKEITSPFVSRLLSKLTGLTPTEIRICDFIRRGLSNKEIARLERSSAATVHKHRAHIRRKLGIRNRKVNLTAHLESLMPSSQEES